MRKILVIVCAGLLLQSNVGLAQNQTLHTFKEKGTAKEVSLLEIYPNPVSEYLNITQQQFDGSISQLEIIDLSGDTVYKVNEKFTQLSIFVGNWQKGIYMVFFRQGNTKVIRKIVVQ